MAERSVDIKVTATDQASAVVRKAGENIRKELSAMDRLKSALGPRSDFKDAVELLAGGGAIVGLSLAAKTFADLTGKAVELKDALNDGSKSAGEVADEFIRAFPILGKIYETGRNIRELIDGEEAAARRIRENAEATNKALDIRAKMLAQSKKDHADVLKTLREMNREIFLLSQPADQRSVLSARLDANDKILGFNAEAEAKAKARNEQAGAAIDVLSKQLQKIAIPELRGGSGDAVLSNRAEVDAALAQQRDLMSQISQIAKERDEELAKIESDRQTLIRTALREGLVKQTDEYRKAAEEQAKEQKRAAEKQAEDAKRIRDKQLRDQKDYFDEQKRLWEKSQRDAETLNDRIDSALSDFFEFEEIENMFIEDRKKKSFRGTAEAEKGGTLRGFAAAARERAFMGAGADPERQERDRDRRDAKARHDDLKRKLDDNNERLIRAITVPQQQGGASLN